MCVFMYHISLAALHLHFQSLDLLVELVYLQVLLLEECRREALFLFSQLLPLLLLYLEGGDIFLHAKTKIYKSKKTIYHC